MKTPEQGGDVIVNAAVSKSLTKGGFYIENYKPASNACYIDDLEAQSKLWNTTCAMLRIENFGKD